MIRCLSIRKQGCAEQCPSSALRGMSLCGKHARMKSPVIWSEAHKACDIVSIQALVRGWMVRRRLHLAGKGALARKDLENEDELFHYGSKDKCSPLDYFSIEERGKVWWFDSLSLWKWVIRSHAPTNPYTRTPLSFDTRRRLRELWIANRKPSVWSNVYLERLHQRWNVLCQIFAEYGFVDIHPGMFVHHQAEDYLSMFVLLHRDLQVVLPEKHPYRARLLNLCQKAIHPHQTDSRYPLMCTYILLLMLTIPKDSYIVAFSIMSALYRC